MLKQNEMLTGAPEEERLTFLRHGGRRYTPRHSSSHSLSFFQQLYTVHNKIEECEPPLTYEANTDNILQRTNKGGTSYRSRGLILAYLLLSFWALTVEYWEDKIEGIQLS